MKGRSNTPIAALVLTAAMLDCFAIPLLVIASQRQQHYDEAPTVVRETHGAAPTRIENPHIIELGNGAPILDDEPLPWEQLVAGIHAASPDQQILVRVRTSDDGQGPVSDLLRLSLMAHEHGFANRLLFISRQPESSSNVKGVRS